MNLSYLLNYSAVSIYPHIATGFVNLTLAFDHVLRQKIQWNPSIKATQDGGLSKELACHEG